MKFARNDNRLSFFELIKLIAGLFALISGQTEWVDPIYDDKATFPQKLTNMQQMLRTMPYFPEGMVFMLLYHEDLKNRGGGGLWCGGARETREPRVKIG